MSGDDIWIRSGSGATEHGPGVTLEVSRDAVAAAIMHWLHANGVRVDGVAFQRCLVRVS